MASTQPVFDSLIRVSKMDGRVESAESTMTIIDQRGANEHAIRAKGGRVGREFRALDQSGSTVTESRAWREALARCQSGESAGIVIAYGDRLARNWRALGGFYDELEAAGAQVIIAGMPHVDYRTADGRMMTGMMAVVADMQWQTAKARGDKVADLTLARGVPNRAPYGYRRNGTFVDKRCVEKIDADRDAKALVPDPEQARWVALIYRRRADGYSWSQIADELAAHGVPAPSGAPRWERSSLSTVIRNRAYLGVVTLGKHREPVRDAHEPLVTEGLWHRAQSTHGVTRNGTLGAGLATGLIRCVSCGGTMSIIGATARPGAPRRALYSCRRDSSQGKCIRPMTITKAVVDAWLDDWVARGVEGEQPFAIFASARELVDARAAVDRAQARRRQIVLTAAEWDPEDAKAAYDAAKAVEAAACERYDALVARADDAAVLPASADAWHALDLDHQRRVLRLLVDSVIVAPPRSRSKFAVITERLTLVERGT